MKNFLNTAGAILIKRNWKILIVIIVFLIAGWVYYYQEENKTQNETNELACLQQIKYRGNTIYRIEGESDRNFKTQEEAMNYCLKVLN